jgi:hypothetical protein
MNVSEVLLSFLLDYGRLKPFIYILRTNILISISTSSTFLDLTIHDPWQLYFVSLDHCFQVDVLIF